MLIKYGHHSVQVSSQILRLFFNRGTTAAKPPKLNLPCVIFAFYVPRPVITVLEPMSTCLHYV